MWFFAILVVLLLGGIAAVASGYGRPLAEVHPDDPDTALPAGSSPPGTTSDRPLRGADLRGVRFPLALRGYRMAEVDALLDRLARQLDEHARRHPGGQPEEQPPGEQEPGEQEPRDHPGAAGGERARDSPRDSP